MSLFSTTFHSIFDILIFHTHVLEEDISMLSAVDSKISPGKKNLTRLIVCVDCRKVKYFSIRQVFVKICISWIFSILR